MIRFRACVIGVFAAIFAGAQPRRIVSTFPSITETLFALGVGDRVVGVSNYCRYPPAVLSLPKVGTYTKPDAERIALLRPDLVIIQKSGAGLADRLTAMGIMHAEVTVGSLNDVYAMIRIIGAAAGVPDRAKLLDADIQFRLEAVRAATGGGRRPSVLMIVGRTPGMLTNLVAVGPATYLGELLEIAGGKNVLKVAAIGYPRISLETVVRLNPEVILDLSLMGSAGSDVERGLRKPWMAHRELAAVRDGMIFGLTAEPLVTPGPRVVEAVDLLRADLLRAKIHSPENP